MNHFVSATGSSPHFLLHDPAASSGPFSAKYTRKGRLLLHALLACLVLLCGLSASFAQTAPLTVSGTVTDTKGEPLARVGVEIEGAGKGTMTDDKGAYRIAVPRNGTLVFSYVGYDAQRIAVSNRTGINVSLETAGSGKLNEVVVVGYGTMKKKDLTGAIGSIKTDKLEKESPRSVQDLLRGNMPGLNIAQSNDAQPSASLQIRGQRSLKADNEPLVVVDGVIFFGGLTEINPMDVEQVDVLKDASSAAIYGAKSANGVIIITTKKGRAGKPTVRLNVSQGMVTMGANRPVYDANGYIQFRQDLFNSSSRFANPGKYINPTPANLSKYGLTYAQWRAYDALTGTDQDIWLQRIGLYDQERANYAAGKTFDWYDYSFQNGLNQNYDVSTSGRSENFNYYFSLGAQKNTGVIVADKFRAYRGNLKLEGKVNRWMTTSVNINFQDRTDADFAVDWGAQIINNSPFALAYDSNGAYTRHPMGENLNKGTNSLYTNQFKKQDKKVTVLNTILSENIKLPFNITYTLNFSPRLSWSYNRYAESSRNPDWSDNGKAIRENTKNFDWQVDNIIKWSKTIADRHYFDVTLLQNAEEHRSWYEGVTAVDFSPTDVLGYGNIGAANPTKSSFSSNDTHSTGDALMARLFYSYDSRYMFTGSVRRDGYSAFGKSNPRATFTSLAFAWNFGQEKFFKWSPLSTGKLRLSYGQNGNRSIGIYQALSNLTTGSGRYAYVQSNGTVYELSQLYTDRMANYGLKWEATTSGNIGLDFGFLGNRINGSIDAYYMPTTDLLVDQSLPGITGFSTVTSNLGEVVNKGLEVAINSVNMRKPNFNWSTTLGFSANRNTIKHLYYTYKDVLDASGHVVDRQEINDIANGWFIGHDIASIWTYKTLGIWQKGEETQAAKYGEIPGDVKVQDVNGDGKFTNDDKQFLGYTTPRYRFNLRNDFTLFKNFDLTVNVYSYLGQKATSTDYMNNSGANTDRTSSYVREYWTPENPSNTFARLNSTNPSNVGPARVISKSFVRFDNIGLSYLLPARISKMADISQFRVSAGVRNAAVWAPSWQYWDPEITGPMPRTYTLSLSVTF
ncbi:MAG: SusC/RagA family TonB-linked outer membrane protein [Williamsia sp.]|nr:SusC/RagA family TonB-linked outer membrane protein [Williamsia sp.]